MRLLDLCCKAGGASKGYADAGFEVVGVDIEPQPNYPYEFVQADALTFPLEGFDAVHASPPCHDYSTVTGKDRKRNGPKGTGYLLPLMIARPRRWGGPWIVENVEAARPAMPGAVRMCGSSFGLDVRRHRLFLSDIPLAVPPCDHAWQTPRFRSLAIAQHRAGKLASVVGVHGNCNYAGEFSIRCAAMGIDWMTNAELCQAIPPAYTEHIGRQLAALLEVAA